MITMTSRDFNQDTGRAKRAAMNGPVFITDRGKPAHVLLSIDDYSKLAGICGNAAKLLACRDTEVFDFEPEKLQGELFKAQDFG
jgi:prevent-host-death family protein